MAKVQRVVGNFAGARYIDGNAPIQDTLRITSDSLAQTDLFLVDDSIMISFSFTANDSLRIVDYYQQTQFDGRGTEGKGWISANNDSLYLDYTTIVTDNGIYDTTLHVFTGKRF
ncbi:MAG: hypothetical protein SFW35_03830 [Chitinophagales bacterium]|nr:hypothetical protein [Chitinophagales bacterium]